MLNSLKKIISDTTNCIMNEFLRNSEKELHSYESISEKNCIAIHHLQKNISSLSTTSLGSKETFDKLLQVKKEHVIQKAANLQQKSQMIGMSLGIKKKEKVISNLQEKFKKLTEEYENLKAEKAKEEQENRITIKIFAKALKYYTKHFQYIIEKESTIINEDNKFCVIITFIFEGKPSKYPIWFVFDKQTDSLISFNAGLLLNEKQHQILQQRFKESNNYPALFCTLREAALRKHKE